ncbi:FAD-dependent oxidoreductase [Micromonospora sp. SL1-18]|uniref:FAD-dependent oxidoreductase n=1 Tax=Micromonospora sp. SL1-18 TaxID=3399128 RepID=UPI003A4E1F6B
MSERITSLGNRHAVVVGASIAGLLAARALSETFDRVTVLERDDLPAQPAPRRGVPQSRHLHILLARGAEILDELFPGITDEMVEHGAVRNDPQVDTTYYLDGRAIAAKPSDLVGVGVSRPMVEHLVRQRVERLPNVEVHRAEAVGLLTGRDGATVTGVRTNSTRTPELTADLVVDAAGRGSRALHWLRDLGIAEPPSSRVEADVVYVTRNYRWEPGQLDGRHGCLIVPFPGSPRGAGVVHMEDDRWGLVLFGLVGENPPIDEDGMLAFAESLPVPDIAKLMREAKPLDDAVRMRYPASVRWHFERQRRQPEGFLVTGDALCSFNPTYGQGMSVAAMEALILRDLAAGGTAALPTRFYRAAARVIDGAWTLAAGGDLRFPEIPGRRTAADRLLAGYLDRYRLAATVDPVLARTFLRVAQMLAPATAMVSPGHLIRVFGGARRARC